MRCFWLIGIARALVHAFPGMFVYFLLPGGYQCEAVLDVLDRAFSQRVRATRGWRGVADDAGEHFAHGCNYLVLFG